jgi:hypothetical protein
VGSSLRLVVRRLGREEEGAVRAVGVEWQLNGRERRKVGGSVGIGLSGSLAVGANLDCVEKVEGEK